MVNTIKLTAKEVNIIMAANLHDLVRTPMITEIIAVTPIRIVAGFIKSTRIVGAVGYKILIPYFILRKIKAGTLINVRVAVINAIKRPFLEENHIPTSSVQ